MTTTEHLERIKQKCLQKIDLCERNNFKSGCEEAGWRATIAAIDGILAEERLKKVWNERVGYYFVSLEIRNIAEAIITAWPEELL